MPCKIEDVNSLILFVLIFVSFFFYILNVLNLFAMFIISNVKKLYFGPVGVIKYYAKNFFAAEKLFNLSELVYMSDV